MASFWSKLKAQLNPFDGGKTWDTVANNKRVGYRQFPQANQGTRGATQQPKVNVQALQQAMTQRKPAAGNSYLNSLKMGVRDIFDANTQADYIRRQAKSGLWESSNQQRDRQRKAEYERELKAAQAKKYRQDLPSKAVNTLTAGTGRGAVGIAQDISGLVDLVTPGKGTSDFTKLMASKGKLWDEKAKLAGLNKGAYTVAQAPINIAAFASPGKVAKGIGVGQKGVKIGKTASVSPRVIAGAANVIADTLQNAGNRTSKGQDNSAQTAAIDAALSLATGGVISAGGKLASKGAKKVVKGVDKVARNKGFKPPTSLTPDELGDLLGFRREVGTGSMLDDGLYERGVAAAKKAGIDYRDNDQIDSVLNAHLDYEVSKSNKKPIFKPLNQGGYVKLPGRKSTGKAGLRTGNPEIDPKTGDSVVPNQRPAKSSVADSTINTIPTKQPPEVQLPTNAYQNEPQVSLNQNQTQLPQTLTSSSQNLNTPSPASRQRGFIETVVNDANTSPQVKQSLSSLYQVRNTKDLQTKAANLVKDNPDIALRLARAGEGDISVATGSELVKHLQETGNFEQAIDLTSELAAQLTKAGQTAQAASIYGRLTPEGVLRFAQKEINKYNQALGKNLNLTPAQAKSLTDKARALQNMPEGRDRDIAIKQMMKEVYELMPSTWVQKVGTLQTMGQLLNPKTLIRNIGGNSMFGVLDNVSQAVATPLDIIASKISGKRTTGLPQLGTQLKGLKRGLKEGYEEAVQGVNLGPETQFELNEVPAFRKGLFGSLEKTMNVSLRAPDRAAYQAAFDDKLANLMKLNGVEKPTKDMIEQAHMNGLYRTFQDDSVASQVFTKLKKSLNTIGVERNGKKFGLGDFILKYPKTPGNLLARGIDYSPAGIVKGIINIAQGRQEQAVNSLARGAVGTGGIIGAGAVLGSLGIITEKPEADKDLRDLQKQSGQGGYQINMSALKRFILSGFDKNAAQLQEGDMLASYDWAQPTAIPLSMGAAIGRKENVAKGASQSLDSLAEGVNTLAEQPLVKGVQDFFGGNPNQGAVDKLMNTAKGMPASFIPTLSSQVNQLIDNTARSTYDPSAAKQSVNMVKAKIPGLAQTLKPQVDALGNNKERYQGGSNNPFNVFLNPAFVSKYKPSEEAKLALDIYNRSGETKQAPRVMSTTQKVNGENIKLTPKQNEDFQRYVGQSTTRYFKELEKDPKFKSLSDEEKANTISSELSNIVKAGKIAILGDSPDKVSKKVKNLMAGGVNGYKDTSAKTTYAEKYQSLLNEYNDPNNGWSNVQKTVKAKELKKLGIQKDYDEDTVSLYGMSKADMYDYITTSNDGKKLADKLIAYDNALFDAGLIKSKKFKTGLAPSKGGRRGGKKGGRRKTAKLKARVPKLATIRVSRPKDVKIKNFKKPSLKVAKISTKSRGKKVKVKAMTG